MRTVHCRRTLFPGGTAATLDLTYKPIKLVESDGAEPKTRAIVSAVPVNSQVHNPASSRPQPRKYRAALPQDEGQLEMIRSLEMLRHSPTMTMLFDEQGQLIQAPPPSPIRLSSSSMYPSTLHASITRISRAGQRQRPHILRRMGGAARRRRAHVRLSPLPSAPSIAAAP